MAKTEITVPLQVSAADAARVLPGKLVVGADGIEIWTLEAQTPPGSLRGAQRFAARWSRGTQSGTAYLDVRPTTKLMSELQLTLETPDGFWKLLSTKRTMSRLAELFARALRYEIETRSVEEADAFEVRRTSEELVRARSA